MNNRDIVPISLSEDGDGERVESGGGGGGVGKWSGPQLSTRGPRFHGPPTTGRYEFLEFVFFFFDGRRIMGDSTDRGIQQTGDFRDFSVIEKTT
jgi:hypothetical protein